MKTRAERFADSRHDRDMGAHGTYRTEVSKKRKRFAKLYSEQFKAVRQDKRWAMVAMAQVCHDNYGLIDLGRIVAKHRKLVKAASFPYDDLIPEYLYRWLGAHRALGDKTKIACYPTRADAERKREVVMSAGKFFRATFPSASEEWVKDRADAFVEAVQPVDLHFATHADDWAHVYCNGHGFRSCMTDYKDDYNHPVRFYARPGNGLKLAYIKSKSGKIVARAIVNDNLKQYVRVYGDGRLRAALENAGYEHGSRALSGVKCNAMPSGGTLIAPYIDGYSDRIEWDGVSDECTISDCGPYQSTTGGLAEYEDQRPRCERCDEPMDDDDMVHSGHHEVTYCTSCADRFFTVAIVSRNGATDYVRNGDSIEVDGNYYLEDPDLIESFGYTWQDGEWVELSDDNEEESEPLT